jgi:large subunit ribosomal protein L31
MLPSLSYLKFIYMKKDIHPQYHQKTLVTCACGATLQTGSVFENLQTEICASCHPIYTGKKKTLDTTGRVDRFKKIAQKAEEKRKLDEETKKEKQKRAQKRTETIPAEEKTASSKKSEK